MRILGIDPGSTATGYGVVEGQAAALVHVAHGTVRPGRRAPLAERLVAIQAGIAELIETHRPDVAVVEQVFVRADNPRSALVLGEARGVALVTLASAGLATSEVTPQEVKAAVVGTGNATKAQVQQMVKRLLGLEAVPSQDAADALAAAICRANQGRLAGLPARGGRGRGRARGGAWVVRRAR